MERVFKKPLLDENALCIYRKPGSVKGVLVRAGRWQGGSVGFTAPDGGPLVSHRFMQTKPPMGPLVGVSDEHLAEVPEGRPMSIAAEFIAQLADDDQIEPAQLVEELPALRGDVTVQLAAASSAGRWRCTVVVDGQEVAGTAGDTHVEVLKALARQLQESDSITEHTKNHKSCQDLAVSRVN